MVNNKSNSLQNFISNPLGELRLGRLRVGRFLFENISLTGRDAAINFQEMLQTVGAHTRRARIGKDGTRYPEPLPMGAPARLLSIEIADYLTDMHRRNLQLTTITAAARSLKILLIACGNVPVNRIDRQHILGLFDLLRWAPPNITTDGALKGLSAAALIAKGKQDGVGQPAVATFELHRRFLSTFFNTLVTGHAIPFSPMASFREMKKDLVEGEKPERLFGPEDLKKIFNPDTFVPWAIKFPHRWWGPMLGLYTGARINEIAQLKLADIVQEGDVWCIAIRSTMDADLKHRPGRQSRQRLKGKSAVRRIPIAKPLLDAGFLDFLEDVKACGHPRLFPHLSAGINRLTGETNARYSQGLLNQFGTYLKDLGFPKGVGFHGFRHTLSTELDSTGVNEMDIALITGHSPTKKVPVLQDAYIHKSPERVRARQVAALKQYLPPVNLPVYQRGQFKERLRKGAKFYP